MQVQVETDNHVENREKLIEHVEGVIRDAVDRYEDQVTHVEAHLGDLNSGGKSGADDMRCLFEARVAGLKNRAPLPPPSCRRHAAMTPLGRTYTSTPQCQRPTTLPPTATPKPRRHRRRATHFTRKATSHIPAYPNTWRTNVVSYCNNIIENNLSTQH